MLARVATTKGKVCQSVGIELESLIRSQSGVPIKGKVGSCKLSRHCKGSLRDIPGCLDPTKVPARPRVVNPFSQRIGFLDSQANKMSQPEPIPPGQPGRIPRHLVRGCAVSKHLFFFFF